MKIRFKTERLSVRKLNSKDLECFYDMQSNPNVMRYIKNAMAFEESKEELQRFIEYYAKDNIFFNIWGITENKSKQFVGICGVYKNLKGEYEIAYRLRECFWGNAFGTEITKGLIKYCFEKMALTELVAYVNDENTKSIKILEKQMRYEKTYYSEKTKSFEQKYHLKKENCLEK